MPSPIWGGHRRHPHAHSKRWAARKSAQLLDLGVQAHEALNFFLNQTSCRANVLARINQGWILVEELENSTGEDNIQVRGDVDLCHTGANGLNHAFVWYTRRTMQHQGNRNCLVNCGNQVVIEDRLASRHGV